MREAALVKRHPGDGVDPPFFGEVRSCCEHGETEPLKTDTAALGLRSVSQDSFGALPHLYTSLC